MEPFIRWIRGDLKLNDFKDSRTAIKIYIDCFNNHRVAYRLNYLTPVEYRTLNKFT